MSATSAMFLKDCANFLLHLNRCPAGTSNSFACLPQPDAKRNFLSMTASDEPSHTSSARRPNTLLGECGGLNHVVW